jgi:SAM-dependent methyltransferase
MQRRRPVVLHSIVRFSTVTRLARRLGDMLRSERDVVESGYDRIASSYLDARTRDGGDVALLEELLADIPDGSRVLDAGCGSGVPVVSRLREAGHDVVGLDFSSGQLSLARAVLASDRLVQGDVTDLPLACASFGAVVSFYAVIHVPRQQHRHLFEEIYRVLDPADARSSASVGVTCRPTTIRRAGSAFRCSGSFRRDDEPRPACGSRARLAMEQTGDRSDGARLASVRPRQPRLTAGFVATHGVIDVEGMGPPPRRHAATGLETSFRSRCSYRCLKEPRQTFRVDHNEPQPNGE